MESVGTIVRLDPDVGAYVRLTGHLVAELEKVAITECPIQGDQVTRLLDEVLALLEALRPDDPGNAAFRHLLTEEAGSRAGRSESAAKNGTEWWQNELALTLQIECLGMLRRLGTLRKRERQGAGSRR